VRQAAQEVAGLPEIHQLLAQQTQDQAVVLVCLLVY
jgi:hypothetical protein